MHTYSGERIERKAGAIFAGMALRVADANLRFRMRRSRMVIRELSGRGYSSKAMVRAATRVPSAFW
jgi:hypothetical protein